MEQKKLLRCSSGCKRDLEENYEGRRVKDMWRFVNVH